MCSGPPGMFCQMLIRRKLRETISNNPPLRSAAYNKHNAQDLQNQNPPSPRGHILVKHTEAITEAITPGLTGHRGKNITVWEGIFL